ncbi:hypothetical protein [Actinophytocola sp.]|uniref:hypothetical protein n=1 Tax=Actinophytocola sp. TaxID=1872138 RepID=UPI002ED1D367
MPALGAVSSLATSGAVGVASDLAKTPDDRSRMLPVHSDIADLLPRGGLRRGSTVAVRGGTSLLFALLARATETGSWAALVGMPNLGLRAAAELGVAVRRLALVRHPGADLARVVAALLDGMDMVTVDPARLTDSQMHRLSARARHRGAVLLSVGPWQGADLELTQESAAWSGLGDGHGHLAARELHLLVRGRGAAARPMAASLRLPTADGGIADALKDPVGTLPVPKGSFRAAPVTSSGGLRLTVPNEPAPSGPTFEPPSDDPLETLPVPRDGRRPVAEDDPCLIDLAFEPPSGASA